MTRNTVLTIEKFTKESFNFRGTMSVLRSNFPIYLSWGVSKFNIFTNDRKECTGLILKVNGHHHKGYVLITLDMDIYQVTLITTHGNVKEHIENVYVDELVRTIDEKIEKIPIYTF